VLQEVAAVHGVVEVLPLAVAKLAGQLVDTVDAPWAQQLCERFSGARLITWTLHSSSASFMAAAHSGQSAADNHYAAFWHVREKWELKDAG